jgi:D-amino-acid dehydrogenase
MDAIVVGGGIVGTSAAYHLQRAGVSTRVFDRADEGRATDAGAGILAPARSSSATDDRWFDFAVDAVDYYDDLVADLRAAGVDDTGYSVTGLLHVAFGDEEVARFEAANDRLRERQARRDVADDAGELSLSAARERCPALGDADRVMWFPDAARLDGRTFTAAMQRAAEREGAEWVAADVTDVRIEGGTVDGVVADGEFVAADAVVVAGGAWSPAFGDAFGVEIPVSPMRGQILHLDADAETGTWPIVSGTRSHYVVPWSDGHVAVGATYERGSGYEPHTTVEGVHAVLGDALDHVPGLAGAAIDEIRVGLRPGTTDDLPVLGAVPGVEGAYLATGHGPTGLQLGPYSGRQVARLVRGEEPETEMSAFSVTRFGD